MSEQNDSAFLRVFLFVLGGLVAFTVIILFAASLVTDGLEEKQAGDSRLKAVVAERIKPVGSIEVRDANEAPPEPKSGKQVVSEVCGSCHNSGALNAPKVGDTADWQARMDAEGGLDGLTKSAIVGKGAMPPRGGGVISDGEVRDAIIEMLKDSKVEVGGDAASAEKESAPAAAVAAVAPAVEKAVSQASGMMDSMMNRAANMANQVVPGVAPAYDLEKGKSVYDSACFACHGTGAAGAPKIGDKAAWVERIAQGTPTVMENAIKGKGTMPPKGGRMDIADDDVKAAVAYMIEQSR